jgi:hypothetical protein
MIVKPLKFAGRVVIGPRKVQNGYARIVACEDGSGRIELYDAAERRWYEASEKCSFSELWTAPATAEPCPTDAKFNRSERVQPLTPAEEDDADFEDGAVDADHQGVGSAGGVTPAMSPN